MGNSKRTGGSSRPRTLTRAGAGSRRTALWRGRYWATALARWFGSTVRGVPGRSRCLGLSPKRGPEAAPELEIAHVLGGLAAASRLYRRQLEDTWLLIERLSEDYAPAMMMATSMRAATAKPARLGTVRDMEERARAAPDELGR